MCPQPLLYLRCLIVAAAVCWVLLAGCWFEAAMPPLTMSGNPSLLFFLPFRSLSNSSILLFLSLFSVSLDIWLPSSYIQSLTFSFSTSVFLFFSSHSSISASIFFSLLKLISFYDKTFLFVLLKVNVIAFEWIIVDNHISWSYLCLSILILSQTFILSASFLMRNHMQPNMRWSYSHFLIRMQMN